MTFRCTRHFFLTRKESMIFEGLTLVVLLTGFSNFACIFWLQNREWLSLHSALLFPAGMFFRTTKERMTFSCIRHHFLLLCMSFLTTIEWILFCVASDNIMHSSPFAPVFSDDISLHPPLSFVSMYVFSDYKSGDKGEDDFFLHPPPFFWSDISDSQQRIFPIGFIFLKLPPPPRAALLVGYMLLVYLPLWMETM